MQKYVPGSYVVTLKPSPAQRNRSSPKRRCMAYDVVFFTNAKTAR